MSLYMGPGAPPIAPITLQPFPTGEAMPCTTCNQRTNNSGAPPMPSATVPAGQPRNTATAGLATAAPSVAAAPSVSTATRATLNGWPWWLVALAIFGGLQLIRVTVNDR